MTETHIPNHIAIIMDGNGRWAVARNKKRIQGHKIGMERAREVIEYCGERGIKALTLFAFSSENWNRPKEEVGFLMNLFITGLTRESKNLHKNNVHLRVIGDVSKFDDKLQAAILSAEKLTENNTGLKLQIAANYGGKWDIVEAANKAIKSNHHNQDGLILSIDDFEDNMTGSDLPELDLLIRTGGEQRISNFLLWQAAYAELYFSEKYWPDFGKDELNEAINDFSSRQRRYGLTGEQVETET